MYKYLLLIVISGLFASSANAACGSGCPGCSNCIHYEQTYYPDYAHYHHDFIVGNHVYHWEAGYGGRRILNCREIYYTGHHGVYFGEWQYNINFDWNCFNPQYFSYDHHMKIYYYNHPQYTTHYNHLSVHIQVNANHFYPGHVSIMKPWIHWSPWRGWRHARWNVISHPKHKVVHHYQPHIKHTKLHVGHKKLHVKQGMKLQKKSFLKTKKINHNNKPYVKHGNVKSTHGVQMQKKNFTHKKTMKHNAVKKHNMVSVNKSKYNKPINNKHIKPVKHHSVNKNHSFHNSTKNRKMSTIQKKVTRKRMVRK